LAQTGVGVEKVRDQNVFSAATVAAAEFFVLTSAKRQLPQRVLSIGEEADQSLEVLGSRCQEELLSNKPQSPQA
jgi:hypothetical protein